MALSTAALKQPQPDSRTPADAAGRSGSYGGLVGHLIHEIDSRLAGQADRQAMPPKPEDLVHHVSVACGYAGLIAGFAIFVTGLSYVL